MFHVSQCKCGTHYLNRIPRKGWMKLFWTRGLYACASCSRVQFLPAKQVDEAIRTFREDEIKAQGQAPR